MGKYLYYVTMKEEIRELPEGVRLVVGSQAGLVTCERDWRWTPPPLPDYDLWIVLEGEGSLEVNGAAFNLCAGRSFVFPPGTLVRGEHDPGHRLRVLFCHFQILDAHGELLRDTGCWPLNPVALHDVSCVEMLGAILLQGLGQADPAGVRVADLALRQLLMQRIMDSRVTPPTPKDARIVRVRDAIQAEPERQWHLADMARVAHVSVSQFRRLFKTTSGVTPNAYLVQERITRACKLLGESELPLAAIADTLGYRDVYYFSRQFRQVKGTPPAAYRRARRRF